MTFKHTKQMFGSMPKLKSLACLDDLFLIFVFSKKLNNFEPMYSIDF